MTRPPLFGIESDSPEGHRGWNVSLSPAVKVLVAFQDAGVQARAVGSLVSAAIAALGDRAGPVGFVAAGRHLAAIQGRRDGGGRALFIASELEVDLAGPGAKPQVLAPAAARRVDA